MERFVTDDVLRRLDTLEGQNRAYRRGLLVLGVVTAALGLALCGTNRLQAVDAPAPAAKPKRLVTEGLRIVDEKGVTRAEFGTEGGAVMLRLLGEEGIQRLAFSQSRQATTIALLDEQGKVRSTLGLGAEGPYWRLDDATGRQRAALGVVGQGTFLRMDDENGVQRVGVLVSRTGTSANIFNAAGQTVFSRGIQ